MFFVSRIAGTLPCAALSFSHGTCILFNPVALRRGNARPRGRTIASTAVPRVMRERAVIALSTVIAAVSITISISFSVAITVSVSVSISVAIAVVVAVVISPASVVATVVSAVVTAVVTAGIMAVVVVSALMRGQR